MWELEKEFTFEAAHHLPNHDGKCRRVHGHSWRGRVILRRDELDSKGPKVGMVLDYGDIKAVLQPLVDKYLDHRDLNSTLCLENPTSEEIAWWVYDKLKAQIPYLVAVRIEETCTSACTYYPNQTSYFEK